MMISYTQFAEMLQDLFGDFFIDSLEKFDFFQRNLKTILNDIFRIISAIFTKSQVTFS